MEEVKNYKKHIFIPTMLAIIILLGISLFLFYRNEKRYIADEVDNTLKSSQYLFASFLDSDALMMESTLGAIMRDEKLKAAMKSRDRGALFAMTNPLFEQLHLKESITHFYFTGPDRVNILRVHKPEKYGDRIDRVTTLQAEQTGKRSYGIELGPMGTFTLRVVVPWFDGKQLIGYVELGEEIEHILHKLRNTFNIELFVIIDKQYLNRKDWESGMKMLGYGADWDRFPSVVLITKAEGIFTDKLAKTFSNVDYKSKMQRFDLSSAESSYVGDFINLKDAGNRNVGIMVVMRNITTLIAKLRHDIFMGVGTSLVVGLFLIYLLHIIFNRVEIQRKKAVSLLHATIESTVDGILVVDKKGEWIKFNQKFIEMWKIPDSLVTSGDDNEALAFVLAQLKDSEGFLSKVRELYAQPEKISFDVIEFKDGRYFERFSQPQEIEGKVEGRVWSFKDITERKKAEEALRASEAELHDNYFAQATINMILSESLENIPLEKFLQKALNMILSIPWIAFESIGSISIAEDDADVLAMKAQINIPEPLKNLCVRVPFGKCLCGKAAQSQNIEFADHIDERHDICYEGMHPHGHYSVPILSNGKTLGVLHIYLKEGHVRDKKEEEFLQTVADTLAGIIMRKKAEDRIEYLAYYDGLTGLTNRNLFIDRSTQGIARAGYSKKIVAVLAMDIDRFKLINDTYGLESGDAVLKTVANRLTGTVREGDTVARIGGDGFGLLLIDIVQPEDIIVVVEKVIKNVSQPIQFEGKEIVLTISIGISVYPGDGNDASTLIKNAEMALARAKQQGRKNCRFYTEDMDIKASEFVQMETNLLNAIKNEEFILHYHPYWDISSKKMTGMEALVRWQSPEFGLVSPGKFIPVLEDTRMIIEVGEWILRTAIRQVKAWQDKGHPVVPVSVNLSPIQFRQKDITIMIEKIIREHGFYPSLLTLEITESAFMQDIEFTHSVLENLKNIGISISIDDFGTGYSSLSYLKRFPIDNLKIDISFIREMVKDPDSASIVVAIINMAHTLNLKTIAEGIETEEQWNFLRLLRCDMGQGFYLSKPLPAEDVEKLFGQQ